MHLFKIANWLNNLKHNTHHAKGHAVASFKFTRYEEYTPRTCAKQYTFAGNFAKFLLQWLIVPVTSE